MFFNFLKSKPTLKEVIPDGFVDIHSHILPGIDDGAKNIKESLIILDEIKELKFKKIIATPHIYPGIHNNSRKTITNSHSNLLSSYSGNIEIKFAAEYILDDYIIEEADKKNLLCVNDNYVLVEMSYISAPINLYNILFSIITNGYIPILAHPERYRYFFDNLDEFIKLKKIGCLFQLNILSILGYYGNDIAKFSDKILDKDLFDFVGTDIHNINHIKIMDKKVIINNVTKVQKLTKNNNQF